jgi:hypothetical protein
MILSFTWLFFPSYSHDLFGMGRKETGLLFDILIPHHHNNYITHTVMKSIVDNTQEEWNGMEWNGMIQGVSGGIPYLSLGGLLRWDVGRAYAP